MAEDILFHISNAITVPPNFRARLSHIRKSYTFTTYSHFCIITQGKIQGLNQIGMNASAAAGSIALASVQDGDKYTFTLLLQPRSRKSPLPVGTPYTSTAPRATVSTFRPYMPSRPVTADTAATAVQVYAGVDQKVFAATTFSFFGDTRIYGGEGGGGFGGLGAGGEFEGLGAGGGFGGLGVGGGGGWLSTGGDPQQQAEATSLLQDPDTVHIYHCGSKIAHLGKGLVVSTTGFQKYPRILRTVKQVKELQQLMFPARKSSSNFASGGGGGMDGDNSSVVLYMSCLSWNALRGAIEFAMIQTLRFQCTQDRTYDRSPEAFRELPHISGVAMELDMNDLLHECSALILDR
ncbi:hypothetical protein BG006_011500 [Podila minutissima]|uniref:Uncharacterized protein n=1 Tax=Podila minutissima TaxID=64525 RepID=A0A9P5VHX2_9FUNG|nr:hypothetical protein BG006_011500 [Podila minutissima]